MTSIDEFFGNYLKADELKGKPDLTVTVKEVKVESVGRGDSAEDKPVVYFKELEKGLCLNQVNAQAVAEALGSKEIESWTAKQVVLYVDPNVTFGGKRVGGIRVRVPSQGVVE